MRRQVAKFGLGNGEWWALLELQPYQFWSLAEDEDFEMAVKKQRKTLNWMTKKYRPLEENLADNEKEYVILWEKKTIVEEKAKADLLKLPPTFFCGVCCDTVEDNENGEDFQSELQNVQEAEKSQSEDITSTTESVYTGTVGKPVDLSTRKENDTESTESISQVKSERVLFEFGSGRGLSFADLASSNSGVFAIGPKGTIGHD